MVDFERSSRGLDAVWWIAVESTMATGGDLKGSHS
jgi:hypothetical protein